MKKVFWSAMKVLASPGKNLWKMAAQQESYISRAETQKQEQTEEKKNQIYNEMRDFEEKMNVLMNQLEKIQ